MRIFLAILVLTSGLACEKTIKEARAPHSAPLVSNAVK
jgi:hypothetical protein